MPDLNFKNRFGTSKQNLRRTVFLKFLKSKIFITHAVDYILQDVSSEESDAENTSNSKKLDAILDQYLIIIKPLSVDTYTDPLLFWKINESRFKELEPLAEKVLGVQALEAAVERMLS